MWEGMAKPGQIKQSLKHTHSAVGGSMGQWYLSFFPPVPPLLSHSSSLSIQPDVVRIPAEISFIF